MSKKCESTYLAQTIEAQPSTHLIKTCQIYPLFIFSKNTLTWTKLWFTCSKSFPYNCFLAYPATNYQQNYLPVLSETGSFVHAEQLRC